MSTEPPDRYLDLDSLVSLTPDDVEALRRIRAESPAWILLDYRQVIAMLPPDALDRRTTAGESWAPFSLA